MNRRSLSFFALAVSLLWPSLASAEDYYWRGSPLSTPNLSSPDSVCAYISSNYNLGGGLVSGSGYARTKQSETKWLCDFHASPPRESFYTSSGQTRYYANRYGDSCPSGMTYNSETGACDAPQADPCEPTIGQTVYHEFRFKSLGDDGNPSTDPPITVCKNQCQYSHTYGDFSSKRDFGPPDELVGSFEYKGNGISCTPSASDPSVFDQPPSKDPVTTPPEYTADNNCSGWETQPDGTLKRNCTSSAKYEDKGEVECKGGTAGSGFSASVNCTPTKTPEKTQTDVTQESTKTNNPDGSTDTTTTTDTTKTNCKGLNPCTSTSKTETTTGGTNADGTPGNDSTTCTGAGCNPDNPNEGEEEGEEAPERTAAAGACDAAFQCSGDPIDCELLRQQKEQKCHAEEMSDFDGSKSDIESLVQGEQFELDTNEIQAPSFINAGTRFLPTSCPPPQSITLSSNGGHTYQFSYEPLCSFASDFSFIIVTFVALWCAVYVGRAFGGE